MSTVKYIISGSYDWNDVFGVFYKKAGLERELRADFNIPDEIEAWSDAFLDACEQGYDNGKWKCYQIIRVNFETRKIERIPDIRELAHD